MTSVDLAVPATAADPTRAGNEGFVAKLDGAGQVMWMSYVGGSSNDAVSAVLLRSDGSVAVAGATTSTDLPVTSGAFDTSAVPGGDSTGFVAVISADGTHFIWASYFGSNSNSPLGSTDLMDLEVDQSDGIYISGNTERADLPVQPSAISSADPQFQRTGFLAHFTASGDNVDTATYLPGLTYPHITKGTAGTLLVAGAATDAFPATDATTNSGGLDMGVAEVSLALDHIVSATFVGGAGWDQANEVVPVDGGAVMVGITMSSNFPGGYPISTFHGTIVRVTLSSITDVSPPLAGVRMPVTINGRNLLGATSVTFNGKKARTFTVLSSTQIVVAVPVGATSGKIVVNTPKGRAATQTDFTVVSAPTIASFAPATGGVGANVIIHGLGLDGATAVSFNGALATFTSVSSTQIVATVPPGATSGKISVSTPGGTANRSRFKVIPPPTITGITPSSGAAGITVKITGANFANTTSVTFNGTPAASFTVTNSRLIKAVVPANATTGAITVTTSVGTGSSGAANTFVIPCTKTPSSAICKAENISLPPGAATPAGIVFDGTNIWTANYTTANLTRINPNNGAASNFALPVGANSPYGIAFDGANIWTANNGNFTVTRTNSVSGLATSFDLPSGSESPYGIAFDGTSIWTTNYSTSTVTRLDPVTGVGTNFSLPAGDVGPTGITFDGANIWTANINSGNVTRIDSTTGAATSFELPAGANVSSIGIAFDGVNIWTANWGTRNITRLDPVTGLGTNYALPPDADNPVALAFDGTYVWTANVSSSNVSRIDPVTGAGVNVALPSGAAGPRSIVFDGSHLWTANQTSGNVTRLTL